MLDYTQIINSSKAYKMIEQDMQSSRLSHAYLFVSSDDNYLFSFVNKVCKLLINQFEDLNIEKNNLRIDKKIHPDVKFFGEEKNIDSATTSDIIELADLSPFESDKKVFVLLNVHNMNESSQNKILKTIEEPPKNTYFILTCKNTTKLLQTILSRVKTIELDEISNNQIVELLINQGVNKQKAEICSASSNSNAMFAEKLATDDGFVDFFSNVVSCFFEINGSRDVLKYSNIFTAKNIDKEEFFNIALVICRDLLMILAKKQDFVANKSQIAKLSVIASMLNFDAVTILISTIIKEKEKLNFNVNQTAIIDDFLFKIAEVKVKCRRL